MIYCVVPRPLADELYDKLAEYYKDELNVTVIVDRREFDRRARRARSRASSRRASRRRGCRTPKRLRALASRPRSIMRSR